MPLPPHPPKDNGIGPPFALARGSNHNTSTHLRLQIGESREKERVGNLVRTLREKSNHSKKEEERLCEVERRV